ncbi:MAG: response regulator [Deltaproteobacteria bacterium]|nr:response regulator [Deltaproteobacteria bacterium]
MNPKPTYEELEYKLAHLKKALAHCRQEKKALKQDFSENAEGILRVMFDATHDNALLLDLDGTVLAINTTAANGLGKAPDEMVGRNIYDLLPEKVVAVRKEEALKVASEKRPISFSEETQGMALDWKIYPVFAANDRVTKLAVFGHNITARKRLEAQLQEARKMDALGALAGGVAHQFNNALTAITGNIGLMEMDLPEDLNFSRSIENMKASAHRMVLLTKQLLAHARGGRYHLQTTPMRNFLENTLSFVEHSLKPSVRLETDLPLDLMQVKADRTQMQMVISAIVANANEAIEKEGRIRVSARNVELDAASCKEPMQPGPYVRVTVRDDGKGMDEEIRNRIFEPFFTTHFIGRGLGMAAVYGIMSNHAGSITVESRPGEGTRVHMLLPAVEETEPAAPDVPRKMTAGRDKGTVLIIEDEPGVMEITRETLKRIGYTVIEATTGKAAVQKALSFAGTIDAVLLDIKLPDMGGDQVYPLLMEVRPELKVIVFSGYALDGPAQEILDAGADGFVQKPFSIAGISETMNEVMKK